MTKFKPKPTKLPILSDIPILGALFRKDSTTDSRTELLVLLTPYVMKSPEEAREETARLHAGSASSKTRWHDGWTDSELPRMTEKEMQDLVARRKSRLLKMDKEESADGGVRVSTSMFEEPLSKDKKADHAVAPAEVTAPDGTIPPAVIAPPPSTKAPIETAPAAQPAAAAPPPAKEIDPNAVVPSGR